MAFLRPIRDYNAATGCCAAAEMQELFDGDVQNVLKQAKEMKVGFIVGWFLDEQLNTPFADELRKHGFQFGERFRNPNSANWLTTCIYTLKREETRFGKD